MNEKLIKKILRDYTYLTESLEDIKIISSEAEGEFRGALQKKDEDAIGALFKPVNVNVESVEQVIEESVDEKTESSHDDKDFKKLFRKVVVKCHPDKLDPSTPDNIKQYYKEQYELVTQANENYDWGLLIKIAIDFEIEIDDIDEDKLQNIENRINELKKEISRYESSMAYKWYQMKDETLKDKYLAECAMIFKKHLGL